MKLTDHLRESLSSVFARRRTERAATLDEYADRQAAGEEIDPEDLADAIEAAGQTHEQYLARVEDRIALAECQARIARAAEAEAKLVEIDKRLAAFDAVRERRSAMPPLPGIRSRPARAGAGHHRRGRLGPIANSQAAPQEHKATVADLHRRHREIDRERNEAKQKAEHAKSQLSVADTTDRHGDRPHPRMRGGVWRPHWPGTRPRWPDSKRPKARSRNRSRRWTEGSTRGPRSESQSPHRCRCLPALRRAPHGGRTGPVADLSHGQRYIAHPRRHRGDRVLVSRSGRRDREDTRALCRHVRTRGDAGRVPYTYAAGCFRDSIRAANQGRHSIKFLMMHGRRFEIGGTGDGAIAFVDLGPALHLRILPTALGRFAREVLARLPELRELSIGSRTLAWKTVQTPFGPTTVVTRATLMEIAAVDIAGMPNTSLKLFSEPDVSPVPEPAASSTRAGSGDHTMTATFETVSLRVLTAARLRAEADESAADHQVRVWEAEARARTLAADLAAGDVVQDDGRLDRRDAPKRSRN